ncbi:hypothetical protein GA0115259_105471, partial [Streptomyces sp. MnatMP-M17]
PPPLHRRPEGHRAPGPLSGRADKGSAEFARPVRGRPAACPESRSGATGLTLSAGPAVKTPGQHRCSRPAGQARLEVPCGRPAHQINESRGQFWRPLIPAEGIVVTAAPSPYAEPEMYSTAAGLRRSRDGLDPQPGEPDVLGTRTAQVPVTDLTALLAALLHAQALLRGTRPAGTAHRGQPVGRHDPARRPRVRRAPCAGTTRSGSAWVSVNWAPSSPIWRLCCRRARSSPLVQQNRSAPAAAATRRHGEAVQRCSGVGGPHSGQHQRSAAFCRAEQRRSSGWPRRCSAARQTSR